MQTRGTIIARLRTALKEVTADSMYSNRALWNEFISTAKVLIKRDADNERKLYKTQEAWQKICISMEQVSPVLCGCLNLPVQNYIYRSMFKIPKLVESSTGALVQFISSVDNSTSLTLVTPSEFQIKTNLRYSGGKYAFLFDGYLWTNTSYPKLLVSGIFEGDTSSFKSCEESEGTLDCYSLMDAPSGVPSYLEQPAITMVLSVLLPTLNKPTDNQVNSSESQREASL